MDREAPDSGHTAPTGSRYRDIITEIDAMFDDELEEAVVGLKKSLDAQNTKLLMLIAEYDRRRISSTEYELSTTAWLKFRCRMSATEASGTVKTARALAEMPDIAGQAIAGNVVPSAVKLLARTRDAHSEQFAEDETMFADISTYLDPGDLRRAVSYWVQQVDYPSALDDVESLRRGRRFYFNQSYRGMWAATGDVDPESGHIISTALHSLTDPANLDGEDTRSAPQRNADALTDICQFFLNHNDSVETSGGEKPHITVTVDYRILSRELQRLPEIDGVAIDPETLRRLTCDAGIIPMVLGSGSEVLDVGRKTRTIPAAIRRALDQRDGGCTWKGCTAPASWTDAHHIVHWADGGETALHNLVLLCRRHHTATHEGKSPPDR
ncbi:MAG: HNH endonuclease [Actinomycetia bacterium]|nr:HNH endonuclease [Actinomycetes bacterium]